MNRKGKKQTDGNDGYLSGAIVKIKLSNFMTYKKFELHPGPRMNVILGPNGAGKSTILCAICLGLGGRPSNVGRAGNLSEYIKHGQEKATIELEIYNETSKNYVITRDIEANNKSNWTLNLKPSSEKEINKLMLSLNIHVKNLCQFLPQDKVVEFSKLSSEELLENSEKAANIEAMWENHNKLKEWNKLSHNLQTKFQRLQDEYEKESKKLEYLNKQVDIYNTRQNHLQTIETLKKKKAWIVYETEAIKCKDAIKLEKKRKAEFAELSSKSSSNRSSLNEIKSKIDSQNASIKELVLKSKTHTAKCVSKLQSLQDTKAKMQGILTSFKEKEIYENDRMRRIGVFQQQVKGLFNELSNITYSDADVNDELKLVSEHISSCLSQSNSLQDENESILNVKKTLERELNDAKMALKQYNDVNRAKMQTLIQQNRDAYNLTIWLKDNKHRFKANIYGPIMIEINVHNTAHAKYIENTISYFDMFAFVCEDSSDMKLLLNIAKNDLKLKIDGIMAPAKHPNDYVSPHPINSLKNLGLYSYLREMIDAPDAVMSYLCGRYRFHSIPVGDETSRSKVDQILEARFNYFYTANHKYTSSSSKFNQFGNRVSTRCTELKRANLLTYNVNTTEIQKLERKQKTCESSIDEVIQKLRELQMKEKEVNQQLEHLRRQKREVTAKRNFRNEIRIKIEIKESEIKSLEESKFDLEAEKEELNRKLVEMNKRKLKMLSEHVDLCEEIVPINIERIALEFDAGILVQEKEKIEVAVNQRNAELAEMEKLLNNFKVSVNKMRQTVKDRLDEAKRMSGITGNAIPEALATSFSLLPDSIDDIDAKIYEIQIKFDCITNVDASSIVEFKKTEKAVKELESQKANLEEEIKNFGTDMEAVKQKWLPPLVDLIENINRKFGYYLSTLGCAGEIDLNKGEDEHNYSKYGISIKVKFRDTDKLRELTHFYQSGGERSVATMLYLLSLQEFVKLPFCCVDEINQGMDATNERRVFQLLTQIMSSKTRCQYFLVTPKLLPDMEFDDHVVIHFVICQNSEELPKAIDIDAYIRRRAERVD